MKKGTTYIALLLFLGFLVGSCSTRKAQCGAYAKEIQAQEQLDTSI